MSGEALSLDRLTGARLPLEKSSTLPPEAYTSPEVYRDEVERIFAREWLCAGRVDQVPNPGDYFTLDLLGDRLVVVRGEDERVRVLSRVCRHRAAELVSGSGSTKSFQCPYHLWTYRLDGQLQGAPLMKDAEDFDPARCRLPEIKSEIWEGWVFVNFDDAGDPLGPRLAPLTKLLAEYGMADMVATETAVFDSPFNWKILVDNFMEAYHHIAIHADTFEPIFPAKLSHALDNDGPYSVLVMPTKADAKDPPLGLPSRGGLKDWQAGSLVAAVVFPFHLFAPGDGLLTWYQLLPETGDRFTLRIYSCFPRTTLDDPAHADSIAGLKQFVTHIHHQDIAACEAVWAGLNTRHAEPGRLCPLERSIWQFNQWWIERMTA